MRKFLSLVTLCLIQLCSSSPAISSEGFQIVGEREIRQVISEYVRSRNSTAGIELNVKKNGFKGDLTLPSGQIDYEVKAPQLWEGWGNAGLALIVRVDGRVVKNIPVRVEVEALTDMIVSTRQIEQGEIVGGGDVSVQKRDLATVGTKIVRTAGEVVGKRLKATLRGNAPFRSDQLERLPVVKSGQLVTILLDNELIRVTATGRTKGAGAAGEIVMVQNIVSQKDIQARVIDSSTVRVEF